MNFIGSKQLKTERLILRPTIESDLKTLWKILCISEVNKYYLVGKLHFDWNEEKEFQYKKLEYANNSDTFQWSIVLKANNECIGQISVQENGKDKAIRDIGWFINPKYQRKGYAYETAKEILKYMFEKVQISRIETGAAICNPASWKLMEKLGFKRIPNKHLKAHYTFGGEQKLYSYILAKEEYLSLNKTPLFEIIEYEDKYSNVVKNLLKELQEYIVSIDPYCFNILNADYEDKIFKKDMDEVNNNDGKVYLALEDNVVVGLIMGVIRKAEKDFDYERPNNMGEVIELIVTKNTRSKGIGRKLLNKLEEYFENQNCKTINIDVFGYNDIGKNFYFKNGYHTRMMTVSKKIIGNNKN